VIGKFYGVGNDPTVCIPTFMRLAADEHILTNARRSKWGVRISPACASCRKDDETIPCVARLCAATWV
jgi:hypothetical protein